MSNLGSDESQVLDLEKGMGPEPAPATAPASVQRAAAAELEKELVEDAELVTDPRKAGLVNLAVVVFCAAAIVYFVYNVYSMSSGNVAVYSILCVVPICMVLMARKPLISRFAKARRPEPDATARTARPNTVAATRTACPHAAAAAATTSIAPDDGSSTTFRVLFALP